MGSQFDFCVELLMQTLRNVLMLSASRGIHKMLSRNDFVTKPIFWNFSIVFIGPLQPLGSDGTDDSSCPLETSKSKQMTALEKPTLETIFA
jgi:hypothetical protein